MARIRAYSAAEGDPLRPSSWLSRLLRAHAMHRDTPTFCRSGCLVGGDGKVTSPASVAVVTATVFTAPDIMSVQRCQEEWQELDNEFRQLQETHKVYRQKLEELNSLQSVCSGCINKHKRRLADLKYNLQRHKHSASLGESDLIQQIDGTIKERHNVFFDMEAYLPKKNGFAYKDEYEKFKLYLTIILLLGAIACRFVLHYRVTDEVFNFLLVWYYCTLTIRESVLISNGSRIKGWWVSHHYVSTFLSGVMLTWPNGLIYQMFRNQFLAFSIYQKKESIIKGSFKMRRKRPTVPLTFWRHGCCVQFLQYYYQSGCLYRLRALGERNHLDLTVEGFQSWMWRGLTFLLPFLFFGHFWQLYNAITLFGLSRHEACKEWQVFVLALTFLLLFLGNFLTTLKVVHTKFQKNKLKKH
uniref:Transmembrane protein 120B n=1 Tax=Leptobrachium leishanense TaxID=445787 RepID=A0A8C5LMW0_9ANUR